MRDKFEWKLMVACIVGCLLCAVISMAGCDNGNEMRACGEMCRPASVKFYIPSPGSLRPSCICNGPVDGGAK